MERELPALPQGMALRHSGARLEQLLNLRDDYENLGVPCLRQAQDAGVLRSDIEVKYLCLISLELKFRHAMDSGTPDRSIFLSDFWHELDASRLRSLFHSSGRMGPPRRAFP